MRSWVFIFWISLFLVSYSYVGYGLVLFAVLRIKRLLFRTAPAGDTGFEPEVTFMVAAYNEADFIRHKLENSLELDYPAHKVRFVFVTDGSTDGTNAVIAAYPQVTLLYQAARAGKTMAINRAMQQVTTPFVIFSDANTLLNKNAIRHLVKHFADPKTGAVAGEKKVLPTGGSAEGAGEGMYWKYESLLKKWDAELYSVMGAAGELFAVRTDLYEHVPADTILDDFMISFGINKKGYRVAYAPDAYAQETASATLGDEYKRKIRISAGGFQSMARLAGLLNFFRYPHITWQYVSHRVLRWTAAPLCMLTLLVSNIILCIVQPSLLYNIIMAGQACFYGAAFIGYVLALRQVKIKYFYIPFYFVFMNVAVFHGFFRHLRKRQSAVWERSARRQAQNA